MTTKTIKGVSMPKSELNAYGVGLLRLREMQIASCNFTDEEITFIGRQSLTKRKVIIGKIGNYWRISGRTDMNGRFRAYYVVNGKRITVLHSTRCPQMTAKQMMDNYECRDTTKPLHMMDADEIFFTAKGRKPSRKHAPKMRLATRIANSVRMEK